MSNSNILCPPIPVATVGIPAVEPLSGKARTEFERGILNLPGVKAIDRSVLVAVFDRCRGKPDCFPGNTSVAKEARVSPGSVIGSLNRLESLGIVKTVDDFRVKSRRRIVLVPHPHAAAVLEELAACPHVRMERNRVGAPTKDKRRGRLQETELQGPTICNPGITGPATESSESEAPEAQEIQFARREESSIHREENREIRIAALSPTQVHRVPAAEKVVIKPIKPVAESQPVATPSRLKLPMSSSDARRVREARECMASCGWELHDDGRLTLRGGFSEGRALIGTHKASLDWFRSFVGASPDLWSPPPPEPPKPITAEERARIAVRHAETLENLKATVEAQKVAAATYRADRRRSLAR